MLAPLGVRHDVRSARRPARNDQSADASQHDVRRGVGAIELCSADGAASPASAVSPNQPSKVEIKGFKTSHLFEQKRLLWTIEMRGMRGISRRDRSYLKKVQRFF